jgi:hypothetical protein
MRLLALLVVDEMSCNSHESKKKKKLSNFLFFIFAPDCFLQPQIAPPLVPRRLANLTSFQNTKMIFYYIIGT